MSDYWCQIKGTRSGISDYRYEIGDITQGGNQIRGIRSGESDYAFDIMEYQMGGIRLTVPLKFPLPQSRGRWASASSFPCRFTFYNTGLRFFFRQQEDESLSRGRTGQGSFKTDAYKELRKCLQNPETLMMKRKSLYSRHSYVYYKKRLQFIAYCRAKQTNKKE